MLASAAGIILLANKYQGDFTSQRIRRIQNGYRTEEDSHMATEWNEKKILLYNYSVVKVIYAILEKILLL